MIQIATLVTASLLSILAVPAEVNPGDALARIERQLQGAWNGSGPCDGMLIIRPDGSYERKLHGPGGNNSTGNWKLRWDSLPPTLMLACKKSDEPQFVGRELAWKVVQLNKSTLAITFKAYPKVVFSRSK